MSAPPAVYLSYVRAGESLRVQDQGYYLCSLLAGGMFVELKLRFLHPKFIITANLQYGTILP